MNRTIKLLIGIVILGAVCFVAYKNMATRQKEIIRKAIEHEQQVWQDKTNSLEREVKDLRAELDAVRGPAYPPEKAAEAFGKETAKVVPKKRRASFREIEMEVASFFRYLDNQDYVVSYGLKGGVRKEFKTAVDGLSNNPPIISGEMDSLHRLLKNMAHLFRVTGKNRLKLANDILNNEADIIEPVMNTFYLWFTLEDKSEQKTADRPSLEVLYLYSAYFLNTLAGRSYLLRRDPKIRTLTYYYCVLIVDRANDEILNTYGLDIRTFIDKSYDEIKSQTGLANQSEYLEKLDQLRKKYKMSRG